MTAVAIVCTVDDCQHEDGRRAVATKDAADLKPIERRQQQVQDDEVRTALEPLSTEEHLQDPR